MSPSPPVNASLTRSAFFRCNSAEIGVLEFLNVPSSHIAIWGNSDFLNDNSWIVVDEPDSDPPAPKVRMRDNTTLDRHNHHNHPDISST